MCVCRKVSVCVRVLFVSGSARAAASIAISTAAAASLKAPRGNELVREI
jgi:hypothetical protein